MAFITEAEAFRSVTSTPAAPTAAPPAEVPAAPPKVGNFIDEREATGMSAAPSMFAGALEQGRVLAGQVGSDLRGITQPFRSVLRDSPKVPPPTFDTDAAANRYYRDKSVSPGSVMFSQTNQADTRAQVMKDLANAPPPPPTFMKDPRGYVQGITLGTAGQLSDMFSSIPKGVIAGAGYFGSRIYDELFTKTSREESIKQTQALKDKWPEQLNAPWSVVAKAMGPEALYFYESNPVAFALGHVNKIVEAASGGVSTVSGIPIEDLRNFTEATMAWLGVAGFKKGVESSFKARTPQIRRLLEPKAPVVPGGVEPTLEGALAPELPPTPVAPAPGMGARVRGALQGVRRDFREATDMGTDAVAAAAEAVAASKARIAALTPETPVDLTEALPAAPTKAELKAQTAAVDSLVVDKTKLQEIFGLAARKGPAAEAALVQNIFDRVLQPVRRVEPPGVIPREAWMVDRALPEEGASQAPALFDPSFQTPAMLGRALEANKAAVAEGLAAVKTTKAAKALRVDVANGVILGPDGKPLSQRGAADPSLLKVLGLMGLSAVAANQIYDWWNSSSGLSEDKARDVAQMAGIGLAAAGAAAALGQGPAAGGLKAQLGAALAGLPEGKLIETFRAGGREGEAAAAQIWEDTHRQLGRTIGNMNRQLDEAGIQDISQRVYEKVFKALKQSPDEPGGFRGEAKLSTFLHGVASNEVKNSFAAASRRPATDSMTVDAEGTTAVPEKYMMEQNPERYQSAQDLAKNNEVAVRVQRALDRLTPEHRSVFDAIELEGLSYEEAAAQLNVPIGTVRSRLSRAKEQLQASFRDYVDPKTGKFQSGKIDADAVIALGALGSGVALGAYLDSDNPIRGGVLGAAGVAGFGAMFKGKPKKGGGATNLEYALGLISTELGGISQSLLLRARDYERAVLERTDQAMDAITPFIKGIRKLPTATADALNLALLKNNPGEIAAAIKGNPVLVAGYRQVQNVLAAFRAEQIGMGRFAAGVNEYFPRVVKDLEGLKEALNLPMRTHLETLLVKAEAEMIKTRGREMTDVERSLVVNRALQTSSSNSALPGFAKARGVDVTADLAQFYMTPTESLLRYIAGAVEDAEVAKFFGKDLASKTLSNGQMATHVDKSIGNLMDSEMQTGKISPEQQLRIESILKSRFKQGERPMSEFFQDVRNVTNLGLLGNFASAATQIGDAMFTVKHHDWMPTLGALRMELTGSSRITPKEFGLVNQIAEEFGGARLSGKAVQTAFKYTGFSAIDQFAKRLNLNAGLIKNQQLAQTAKGRAVLAERWGEAFGAEFPQLLQDLAAKRISEPVKSLLFSELSNAQPITKLELPQAYLEHPNGRILYQMHTYMLKQIDIVRREGYQEIAKGNYVKGARNLVGLAVTMSLANIPGDIIKDMLSNRPVNLDKIDYVENLLQNFGINHYTMGKINRETLAKGIKEFAVGAVTPPSLSMLSDLDKPERLIKYIPGVGRPLYDREFGGNEARKWAELVQAKRKERDRLEEASPALKAERLRKAEAIKRKRNEAMQALP